MNPSLEAKPESITKPAKPDVQAIKQIPKDQQKAALEELKLDKDIYKFELKDYNKERKAFADLTTFIQDTIAASNIVYLQETESHPWSILRALKQRLSLSDKTRIYELKKKLLEMRKSPSTNQDINKWLDDYVLTIAQAKTLELAEVSNLQETILDFLIAIAKRDKSFSDIQMEKLEDGLLKDIYKVIAKFKQQQQYETVSSSSSKTGNHSAFLTESNRPTYKGRNQDGSQDDREVPECLCGFKHWWSACYYLNPKAKRPAGWKPKEDIQCEIKEKLEDESLQQRVNKAIEKFNKRKQEDSGQPRSNSAVRSHYAAQDSDLEDNLTFTAISLHHTKATDSPLKNSWILDSGSDSHICNSSMKDRLKITRQAHRLDAVTSGTRLQIKCYGELRINVMADNKPGTILLQDVAYVPDYPTNLVSLYKAEAKGVDWQLLKKQLMCNGKCVANVKSYGGHYLLEDNTDSNTTALTTDIQAHHTVKTVTVLQWHNILGHTSAEAIEHLQTSAEGVKIADEGATAPKAHECETCPLSKTHRIVSRSSYKSEPSIRPFQRVSFDLMHFSVAYNSHQWVSHLACDYTDFNIVQTHHLKSDAPQILLNNLALIRKRFNQEVIFIRTDGEKALDYAFQNELSAQGITFEIFSPDTPAQNGHAERKGGVLTIKARTICIGANIPQYMWTECICAAAYITNRTPTKKHNWKTPYEKATTLVPHLGHLKVYGCMAYSLTKQMPKKLKLAEHAHIGHLVGYDSTNIFQIWIPSQYKVIRTRDVMFDETSFYNPHKPDLQQLIEEPMLEDTLNIPRLTLENRITELDSNSNTDIEEAESSESTKGKEKEQFNYLLTPDPSDYISADSSTLSSIRSSRDRELEPVIPLNLPQEEPGQSQRSRAGEISASLDVENILPEGVTRKRRHKVYTAQLQKVHQEISTFHASFSAFSSALAYYGTAPLSTAPLSAALLSAAPLSVQLHRDSMPTEPDGYKEMLCHAHAAGFIQAITTEIESLQAKQTWKEVSPTHAYVASRTPIPTRWVFKYKFDNQGYLTKYKARLCARGDLQKTNTDTYAATLAARIFRAIIVITAAFDLETHQYDAVNTFVNSPIDEPTYCTLPEGWKGNQKTILLLLRALYGLKQSPALWYKHLLATLLELGLEPVPGVECIYRNQYMLIFFYVDDIAVIYHRKFTTQVDEFQQQLFNTYEMRLLGEVQWFLGIHITRDRLTQHLWLSQSSYIDKLLAKFKISTEGRRVDTPLPIEDIQKANSQATPQDIYTYQQYVGSLNFAAVITRADIAYAVSILSTYLTNPSRRHMELAIRIFKYLAATKHYAIQVDPSVDSTRNVFIASSDVSYGDDLNTRRSTQGYAFTLFNTIVDWKATRQRTVTTSTTEAELLALSSTSKETLWWSRFFEAIDFDPGHSISIEYDNQQTLRILLTDIPRFTTKLSHIDIHHHWLRQEVQRKAIKVHWTPSAKTIADGFTKSLPTQRHTEFVKTLGLVDLGQQPGHHTAHADDEGGVSE